MGALKFKCAKAAGACLATLIFVHSGSLEAGENYGLSGPWPEELWNPSTEMFLTSPHHPEYLNGGPVILEKTRGNLGFMPSWSVDEDVPAAYPWLPPRRNSHLSVSKWGGQHGLWDPLEVGTDARYASGVGGAIQVLKLPNGETHVLVTPFAGNVNRRMVMREIAPSQFKSVDINGGAKASPRDFAILVNKVRDHFFESEGLPRSRVHGIYMRGSIPPPLRGASSQIAPTILVGKSVPRGPLFNQPEARWGVAIPTPRTAPAVTLPAAPSLVSRSLSNARIVGGTATRSLGPMAGCMALDMVNGATNGKLLRQWQVYVIKPTDRALDATLHCLNAGANHILAAVSSVNPLLDDEGADYWRLQAGWITAEEYWRRHPEGK